MSFAPLHDYEAYDAAVANRLHSRTELSAEQKFLRYADFYNTLLRARSQLAEPAEFHLDQKRAKILAHAQLLTNFRLWDNSKNEE